jgi:hypothetical protein|tara:strand:- start:2079 stop:2318 length:240 start_codon:yes stop_codon:yes gene_type:complete
MDTPQNTCEIIKIDPRTVRSIEQLKLEYLRIKAVILTELLIEFGNNDIGNQEKRNTDHDIRVFRHFDIFDPQLVDDITC